jgi:trk system potassium uptake protein TrkA
VINFAIIGLSSFGFFLARELAREGIDVIAIDIDEERIEKIKPYVQKAVIADGTDKAALTTLGLDELDGVVVSLGHIESTVLATLHLKELKMRRIVCKALSEEHGKILEMIGATEVIFPEKDMAVRVAHTLTHENILDHVPLAEGYSIIEIAPPSSFLRTSIGELDLRNRFGVQVIVVKGMVPENVVLVPTADYVIKDSDVLVILGRDEDLKKIKSL